MSRLVREVQGLPPRTLRAVVAGWFVCGTRLPWVRPKRHTWAQHLGSEPWAAPVLVCTRCTRQIGF